MKLRKKTVCKVGRVSILLVIFTGILIMINGFMIMLGFLDNEDGTLLMIILISIMFIGYVVEETCYRIAKYNKEKESAGISNTNKKAGESK